MPTSTGSRKKSAPKRASTQGKRSSRSGTGTAARKTSAKTGKSTGRGRTTTSRTKAAHGTRSAAARSQKRSSGSARRSTAPRERGGSSRASSKARTTIDHDEIREWVEARGGRPSTVAGTERDSETAGLLRIDFPGYSGAGTLEEVDWDDFFEKFEEAKLAFLCDTDPGSKFNKFVARGSKRF
jgi:hypothetical protein